MGKIADALSRFTDPISKLITTTSDAIGEVYKPLGVRRMAKAKAFELQTVAEAMSNNLNLPAQYSDGKITIDAQSFEELSKRAGSRLIFQELRKQQNIEAVVEAAKDELEKEQSVSDEPVDTDWTIRFFNSVEDIGNKELQKLWGKILAGEVKQPGSFSLRSLVTLSNITQHEASLFDKIAKFCVYIGDVYFVGADKGLLEKYGFTQAELIQLSECGLIMLTPLSIEVYVKEMRHTAIYCEGLIVIFERTDKDITVGLSIYKLTGSGAELYRTIKKTSNEQYLLDYFAKMKSAYPTVRITAHRITSIAYNGDINFERDMDLLSPKSAGS